MKKHILKREWHNMSLSWIREVREGRNSARNGLLDFSMLEACGNVEGLKILDSGCGEGRFCRMMVERGAGFVLGLDLCEPMIRAASELKSGNEAYMIADVEVLNLIRDETFDLAVSYLNQCDLFDFNANNREIYRILKKGGRFIVANLHPMRSAVGGWHKSPEGEKLHAIVDNYFDEGERYWKMLEMELTNFHRTLSTYTNGFLEAGFRIAKLIEPRITKTQLKLYPELDDEHRVPNFIVYILHKER